VDKGIVEFNKRCEALGDDTKVFPGDEAHFLFTSMGFPVDLTELMCEERGLTLDTEGFEAKMAEEKKLSSDAHLKKMSGGSGKDMRLVAEQTSRLVTDGVPPTNDDAKYVWHEDLGGCNIAALFVGRGETEDGIGFVQELGAGSVVGVVLDTTNFYAEAGGQTFDVGSIRTAGGATVEINNVQNYGSFVLHVGEVTEGSVSVGDEATCKVDYVRRAPIAANHTMTHVLNCALREVLIPKADSSSNAAVATVDQKGSLVDENKLRFDFSWNGPLTPVQLAAVEKFCVDQIEAKIPVDNLVAPLEDAQKISTLRAVFGETYPDPVRVVAVSPATVSDILADPTNDAKWESSSVEFCGGTHLTNTSEALGFALLSEEGIAKGVRRITAVTMEDAKAADEAASSFEARMAEEGKLDGLELEACLKVLTVDLNELSISAAKKISMREVLGTYTKRVMAWKKKIAAERTTEICAQVIEAAGAVAEGSNKVVMRCDFGIEGKIAKAVTTAYGKKVKDKALLMVTADEAADRFMVVAFAPKGMKGVDCKAWVGAATEGLGGKGGGKKDSAQSTVQGVGSIESVLEKARNF